MGRERVDQLRACGLAWAAEKRTFLWLTLEDNERGFGKGEYLLPYRLVGARGDKVASIIIADAISTTARGDSKKDKSCCRDEHDGAVSLRPKEAL